MNLIVKAGIAAAINSQLGGLKGNRNAIAETIENNVRRTILKEHLNDPGYYEKMSALLDEIIVHELAHLRERTHNERFTALMDSCMPQWRQYRKLLNKSPLGHEDWSY